MLFMMALLWLEPMQSLFYEKGRDKHQTESNH